MNGLANGNDVFTQLNELLDQLEVLAPRPQDVQGNRVSYRSLPEGEEAVNDALESLDEGTEGEESDWKAEEVRDFRTGNPGSVVAVDSGIIRLGETQDGLIIALRGCAAVSDGQGQLLLNLFRSGSIYLRNRDKLDILYLMGRQLGKDDFFVDVEEAANSPQKLKSYVAAWDSHQYSDRFRNWFERLIQWTAASSTSNGIFLLDGALTLRTRDTPQVFLERLAELASSQGNAIIAVSKQSRLQVDGTPLTFLLDDHPGRACYRPISPILRKQDPTRAERVLGNIYVARLSPIGPCFRIDVKPVSGQSDDEVLDQFFASCLMRGGYPDILVRAHTHSYFTRADVLELQAQVGSQYGLEPRGDVDLSTIFAPFGGRFK